jgi:sulfate transport system substrate-binding protein
MARDRTLHVCSACGAQSTKWQGQCPGCNEWNTLVEVEGLYRDILAADPAITGWLRDAAHAVDAIAKAGLLPENWQSRLPSNSAPYQSTLAFLVRKGNPKNIKDWDDLIRPDVQVITPNPKTSGGARWNFLGLWGSITQAGGTPQQAEAYVTNVYKNVDNLPKDAREASDVFLKRDQGDVLLNYENEAILATKTGNLKDPFVVPELNIRIEGPVAVVDKNVDRKGTREAAEALAAYLFSDEAQAIFAEEGFRPTSPAVWARVKDRFAPMKQFFSVKDFGGWGQVNKQFFGDDGIWDRLFANSR